MNNSEKSARLQNFKEAVDLAAKVALPIVVAIVGGCYTSSVKESENRVRYVELAIEQLHATPTPENSALREWAIEILRVNSPINLSSEAIAQMRSHPIALSGTASGAALATGTATLTVGEAKP